MYIVLLLNDDYFCSFTRLFVCLFVLFVCLFVCLFVAVVVFFLARSVAWRVGKVCKVLSKKSRHENKKNKRNDRETIMLKKIILIGLLCPVTGKKNCLHERTHVRTNDDDDDDEPSALRERALAQREAGNLT